MKTAVLKYAIGVGLGGMLTLAAGAGFAQAPAKPGAAARVAQYCVLPPDNPDAHRLYCDHIDGRSPHRWTAGLEPLQARRMSAAG